MNFLSCLKTDLLRLLRSKTTWCILMLTAACPLIGYRFFFPAGEGTTAAKVLANPFLSGALFGSFLFAAFSVYELNRPAKNGVRAICRAVISEKKEATVKTVSLLLLAVISSAITSLLYLPYTMFCLKESFSFYEYISMAGIFLLPTLLFAVLTASSLYFIFDRADLSFLGFTAFTLLGLGDWNRDSYLFYWIDFSGLGFSGDFGNRSIYRMAFYSRIIWLCLLAGLWLFSVLCIRRYESGLLRSFAQNLKTVSLPILSVSLLLSGSVLRVNQPYMDHEKGAELSTVESTGGGMSVYMQEETQNEQIVLSSTELELFPEADSGTVFGKATYFLENVSGIKQNCMMKIAPGYQAEQILVNGEEIPFTDLKNDYFILTKDISFTLPEQREQTLIVTYRGRTQIPANAGVLSLYDEMTQEYISLSGNHVLPDLQTTVAQDCRFTAKVTLPQQMQLIANGNDYGVFSENEDGTKIWQIKGEGIRPVIFAGDYVRTKIEGTDFPAYFCYSCLHERQFEELDITALLRDTVNYCSKTYGSLPYSEDFPLNIVMTSAHMQGGGASGNLSYMGESFFTAENLSDPNKGGSAQEVIAHEIIHQWWGIHRFLTDPENSDWSSEALTCYTSYRMYKEKKGEEYAQKYYVEVWKEKYRNMKENFYLRNPQYLQHLSESQQTQLEERIFDANIYAKAPLQILKAEKLVGGEEKMDEILRGLFQNGGTQMPPYLIWQDFLDACGLTQEQLSLEEGEQNE